MKHYNLIVIGGDGAGMGAASQARRVNKDISIAVFEKGHHVSYAACGIPYFLSGLVKDPSYLLAVDRGNFSQKKNISVHIKSEVTEIDFTNKILSVLHETETEAVSYDKLIIATGATPSVPPIEGAKSNNIFTLRNLHDGMEIKSELERGSVKSVILVGGGFINLELAEAFTEVGLDLTLIEKMESVAPLSSGEIQKVIQETMRENGIKLFHCTDISKFTENNDGTVTVHTDRGDFTADFVVISTGVRPNTEILKETALELTDRGAIIINEKSETNIPGVYAAGDCATVKNLITGRIDYIPMATTANKQGRVAGLQAAGVKTECFPGSIGSQVFKVFDLEVAKTGMNIKDAENNGIEALEGTTSWHSRAGYFPGSAEILVKLTIRKDNHTVIGGEICGTDFAGIRINTIAAAITGKMEIEELAYLDSAYAPPFSPVWDPVLAAAQNFIKRESSGF